MRQLERAFNLDGEGAVRQLVSYFYADVVSSGVSAFLCDAIGRTESRHSGIHALSVLTELLKHPSAAIRDSAVVGLALLDDSRSIPALNEALPKERRRLIRESIEAVLQQF